MSTSSTPTGLAFAFFSSPLADKGGFPPSNWAGSKISVAMLSIKHIAARSLVWLAAIAIPVQGLPAASCGCTGSSARCPGKPPCQRCCCSEKKVRDGQCCGTRPEAKPNHCGCSNQESSYGSACKCGVTCQCGKASLPKPTTPPPVQYRIVEKIVSDAVSAISLLATCEPAVVTRDNEACIEFNACTAQEHCVSLCRFTL